MGSRTHQNLGGSGKPCSRQDWAQKTNPHKLLENGKFTDRQNLDIYLSGDLITCLECGQDCKSLSHHLGRTHSMFPNEYKMKYNIPLGRSLRGEATRKKAAEHMLKRWADDVDGELRLKQKLIAEKNLVGIGHKVIRTSSLKADLTLYDAECVMCKKTFQYTRARKRKYCGRKCYEESDTFKSLSGPESGRLGGLVRADGPRDEKGKFI